MKSKTYYFLAFGLATLLLFITLGYHPSPAAMPAQNHSGHALQVSILYQGDWHLVGELAFDKTPSEVILDLSDFEHEGGWVYLRVEHNGATAAHLDAALLNGIAPSRVYNAAEPASLALRKLAQKDFDLVDISGRTLYLVYETPSGNPADLALTARIEPEVLSQTPYQFPLKNLYQEMTPDSEFYSYRWDSQPGRLTLDGDLQGESLGEPFVSELVTPGSGHPQGTVYWWVFNDAQNLYAALDFVPDNTMDGDKDYAKVYLNIPSGLKSFKVSAPEQTWGKAGFVYTPRAVYQHKVYEFAIPLSELNLTALTTGTPLSLAFAAYGTATPPPPDTYPGPLDNTFDGNGWLTTDFGGDDRADAVAIQKDGKIVVAGYIEWDFALARYDTFGNLDPTFSGDGKLTTDFSSSIDEAFAVALQTDGKIVVVGSRNNDFAVARYETNGDLDPTFSGDGMQTTDLGASDRAYAVDIQADGMIVVAGISGADFGVVRYDPGGNPDNNFDTDGMVVTDFAGSTDTGYAVAIQKDGKIIVAGSSGSDIGLVRYNPNGTRDLGFGIDGKRIFGFSGYTTTVAKSVVVLKDDKIMVAGYAIFQPNPSDYIVDFAVARLNPDGSLDITFQGDGRLTTDFGSFDYASSLLVQHDLKFIVAGTSGNYLAVARYLPNGNLDHTFGTMGKANTYYNGGPASFNSYGYAAALQNDGKIVVVGTHHASIDNDFIVVRYDPPAFFLPLLMK